jgi:hypothetical protein
VRSPAALSKASTIFSFLGVAAIAAILALQKFPVGFYEVSRLAGYVNAL